MPTSNSTILMRMLHRDDHYRPFSSSPSSRGLGGGGGGGVDVGPTRNRSPAAATLNDIYDVVDVANAASAAASDAAAVSGGDHAVVVRPLLQPFDISTPSPSSTSSSHSTTALLRCPGGGMAATLGFPFTNAQWKELERQAMIYKYMVASVPVPPDLLLPINTRNLSAPAASASQYHLGSDFSLRLSNSNTDPEPGRCKRTDGKKWRCSRDVAPDQKYCERHMHRGRPRSRKHVEVHVNNNNNNKRTRHVYNQALPTTTSSATMAVTNHTINNNSGSQTQFLGSTSSLPYHQSSVFLDKSTIKASAFQSASEKESTRNFDWMMKSEPVAMAAASDPQWHQLVQTKMELSSKTASSYGDHSNSSVFNQQSEQVPFLNLNSYANFNADQHEENDQCSLFLNPDVVSLENHPPRSFIDAWSNNSAIANSCSNNNKSCGISSSGKLSPSSLTLSMGGCNSVNQEMGQTQIGSGFSESYSKAHVTSWLTPASSSWVVASQPGGPLAEVLSSITTSNTTTSAVSNPSSPLNNVRGGGGDCSGSPVATAVSSPSGVLQKTLASLSDSSGSSSPTVACTKGKAAEIALL